MLKQFHQIFGAVLYSVPSIFNFIDLNNDNHISKLEFDQSIEIIFQLIDLNQDELISKTEIDELKNVIESLK